MKPPPKGESTAKTLVAWALAELDARGPQGDAALAKVHELEAANIATPWLACHPWVTFAMDCSVASQEVALVLLKAVGDLSGADVSAVRKDIEGRLERAKREAA